jgi:nucleosome binding factor SPN SPT16 subunit
MASPFNMSVLSWFVFQSDEDKTNFQKLIDALKSSKQGKTLGVFSKDNYPGQFMDAWRAVLKKEHFDTVSLFFLSFYVAVQYQLQGK